MFISDVILFFPEPPRKATSRRFFFLFSIVVVVSMIKSFLFSDDIQRNKYVQILFTFSDFHWLVVGGIFVFTYRRDIIARDVWKLGIDVMQLWTEHCVTNWQSFFFKEFFLVHLHNTRRIKYNCYFAPEKWYILRNARRLVVLFEPFKSQVY